MAIASRRIISFFSKLLRLVFAEPIGFVWGALINACVATLAFLVAPHARLEHLMIIHLLGAVLISTRFGIAVSAFTAVTSVLAFDYFCIPPTFTFAVPDTHSVVTFAGMLITALTFCYLNQRLRNQWVAARVSEARTLALCELSLDLSDVAVVGDLLTAAERRLVALFGVGTKVLLKAQGEVEIDRLRHDEQRLALQALDRGEYTNDTSSSSKVGFQPIGRPPESLGVIRVLDKSSRRDQRILLAACADRIGVALERLSLRETARLAHGEADMERSRNALLSAVSHDLKTPLSSILAAGTTLLRHEPDDGANRDLLATIVEETDRMNTLVTNLLNVTRLESGSILLNKSPEALDDLILGVLSRLSGRLNGRAIEVNVPPDLPFVPMDSVLVDHVLANLLENVLRYTPAGSPIEIAVRADPSSIVLEVRDRGPGISIEEREKVFEKFYRGKRSRRNDGGTGLGLTICRAVARAHGGSIKVDARSGGGTIVEFSLPYSEREEFRQRAEQALETAPAERTSTI